MGPLAWLALCHCPTPVRSGWAPLSGGAYWGGMTAYHALRGLLSLSRYRDGGGGWRVVGNSHGALRSVADRGWFPPHEGPLLGSPPFEIPESTPRSG